MRAALYARVSLDEKHGQDLQRQIIPAKTQVAQDGNTLIQIFEERASGADMFRPKFKKMLSAFEHGEFEVLYIYSLDRLARFRPQDSMFVLSKLKRLGFQLKSVIEPWFEIEKLDEPAINLHAYITFWKAWAERSDTTKRSKSGISMRRFCEKSPTEKHKVKDGKCIYCGSTNVWKGGRPKGSRDSKPRERRWKSKPEIEIENLVSSKKSFE